MARHATPAKIEDALVEVISDQLRSQVERTGDMVCVTVPEQEGLPWELHVGWEGVPGEGEHLLWIFSDVFKYEEMWLGDIDFDTLEAFKSLVADLFSGRIVVELTHFRSSGKLWRTRLIDGRRPEGKQVVCSYYRQALRWWRPVETEVVKLGGKAKL
jgi:hypothetical protein